MVFIIQCTFTNRSLYKFIYDSSFKILNSLSSLISKSQSDGPKFRGSGGSVTGVKRFEVTGEDNYLLTYTSKYL